LDSRSYIFLSLKQKMLELDIIVGVANCKQRRQFFVFLSCSAAYKFKMSEKVTGFFLRHIWFGHTVTYKMRENLAKCTLVTPTYQIRKKLTFYAKARGLRLQFVRFYDGIDPPF
jgi:hypothetical protein